MSFAELFVWRETMVKDPGEMTDEELLERIAALDSEKFPLVERVQRVLDARRDDE